MPSNASLDELRTAAGGANQAGLDELRAAAGGENQAGMSSLVKKGYQSIADFTNRAAETLQAGGKVDPNAGPHFDWETLAPEEKRAAIDLATLLLPAGGAAGLLGKLGGKGITNLVLKTLGYAGEGAAVAGGAQAAGNLATGAPLLGGVGTAAATGAAVNPVMAGAGNVLLPRVSPEAQAMLKEGIVPTVGQAVDKGTVAGQLVRRAEEGLASAPVLGDAARAARGRGEGEWRDVTVNRVNPEGGPALEGPTQERLGQAGSNLHAGYENAAGRVEVPVNSQAFRDWRTTTLASIESPNYYLTDPQRQELKDFVNDKLRASLVRNAQGDLTLPGDALKGMESDIKSFIRSKQAVQGTADAYQQRQMGQALAPTIPALQEMRAQISPEAGALYRELDPKWRDYLILKRAATNARGELGDFTPAQALRAIPRQQLQNPPAAGSLQEWLQQGRQVFRNDLPNSGTADRLLPWLLAGSAGAGVYGSTNAPGADYAKYIPLVALGSLGSSRLGQQAALGVLQGAATTGPYARRLATVLSPEAAAELGWSSLDQGP